MNTTLDGTFINSIIQSITRGLDDNGVTTVLVVVSDAEWQLLNRYLAEALDAGHLYWLRLTSTTTRTNQRTTDVDGDGPTTCTYEVPLLKILAGDTGK